MNAINQSGWKPEMGDAAAAAPATFTGNRALMLEEALIFELGDSETTGVDFEKHRPFPAGEGTSLAPSPAPVRSAFPASANPRRCAITPALAARITALIWAFFRSAVAR